VGVSYWDSWLLVTQQLRLRHSLRRYSRKSEIIRYSCSQRWWNRDTRRCSFSWILRKIPRRLFSRMMRQRNSHSCMMGFSWRLMQMEI
jgi:hypothetical protein